MSLDHLIFDTTDATTMADSHNVGAYIRAADGTLIEKETVNSIDRLAVDSTLKDGAGTALTSTLVSGKQGLDVNLVNASIAVTQSTSPWVIGDGGGSITVDAVNLDIRDLVAATDSVSAWLKDGAGTALTSTLNGAKQSLDVNISNASISVTQGTSPWVIGDGGGSITVDAVNLDIRDLVAATDSVSSWTKDGTGTAITSTLDGAKQALDVHIANTISINDAALADTAILSAANTLDVADTAETVKASALANRKYLWIYNNDNTRIFIGSSAVTAANGFPVSPGSYVELRAGASIAPYFVGQTGKTPEIRTLELS